MTSARLARRRRKADDPAFLNRVAQACGITNEQARNALHWWLDQLEPLSEQERDELLVQHTGPQLHPPLAEPEIENYRVRFAPPGFGSMVTT
jgi:hypothetical protein